MQPLRCLAIANVNSGSFSSRNVVLTKELLSLADGKLKTEIVVTEDLSQLEFVINKHKNEGIDLVGIFGGDGTIMQTRTMLENSWDYRPTYLILGGGTMNNLQKAVGLENFYDPTKYLVDAVSSGQELHTSSLASFDLNGRKGFNVGFGLAPKFLWLYYGHSAEKYLQLEQQLRQAAPDEYEQLFKEATDWQEENSLDPLPKRGLPGLVKIMRAGATFFRALTKPHSYEGYLLSTPMNSTVEVWDKEGAVPELQMEMHPPQGVYISSYAEVNFGLPWGNPKPIPPNMLRWARSEEKEKMAMLITYENLRGILKQVPDLMRGRAMTGNSFYLNPYQIKVAEQIAQIDGELVTGNGFTVKYNGEAKIITPPVVP